MGHRNRNSPELCTGLAQASGQEHFVVSRPLLKKIPRRDVWAVKDRVAHLGQPTKSSFFDDTLAGSLRRYSRSSAERAAKSSSEKPTRFRTRSRIFVERFLKKVRYLL